VNILDYRLRLMSIKKNKKAISKFTHALLDILFLRNNRLNSSYSFASVTETNQDYSIVCQEDCVSLLEESCGEGLTVVEDVWIPLVVSVGLEGLSTAGISKIAKSVIIPLADFKVSVYCLSTYKTDYVLVKESDVDMVCRVLAHDFKITKENSLDSEEIIIDPSTIPARSEGDEPRPITHTYTSPANTFYITSMAKSSIETHALSVIDCLFYSEDSVQPNGHESFFSVSFIDNDISMVLDDRLMQKFPPNVLFNIKERWKMVKIGDMPEGLGFVLPGVVAQMSDPIATAQISEYYISTFYYGHTLVPQEDIDQVMNILEQRSTPKAGSNGRFEVKHVPDH